MRILHAAFGANAVSCTHCEHSGSSIALFVHRKDQGALKGRLEEGIRGVTEMMLELGNLVRLGLIRVLQGSKVAQLASHAADLLDLTIGCCYRRQRKDSSAGP